MKPEDPGSSWMFEGAATWRLPHPMVRLDLNSPGFHQTDGMLTRAGDGLVYAYRAEYQVRPSHSGDFDMRIHAVVGQGQRLWHVRQTHVVSGERTSDAPRLVVEALADCIGALPGGIGVVQLRS